jgi:uncharacterized protein YndB with AHSA1/START domain
MAELSLRVDVDAPAERVFAALTDWRQQSEWMLCTECSVTGGDGHSVGTTVEAFTGVGPVGFTDAMEIVEWDPPRACRVRHTGKIVKGQGIFQVLPRGTDASTVQWSEDLDLPLGVLGQASWPLVRPGFALGVRLSLCRFVEFARSYS